MTQKRLYGQGLHKGSGAQNRFQSAKLNLVSLMDIFTILVFFLMFNSSDVQVLQQNKHIDLPESTATSAPSEALVIMISQQSLVVQGEVVANSSDLKAKTDVLPALKKALNRHDARAQTLPPELQTLGREVVVMGDASVPYEILKKVMATCAQTAYRQVSLAVTRKASGKNTSSANALLMPIYPTTVDTSALLQPQAAML